VFSREPRGNQGSLLRAIVKQRPVIPLLLVFFYQERVFFIPPLPCPATTGLVPAETLFFSSLLLLNCPRRPGACEMDPTPPPFPPNHSITEAANRGPTPFPFLFSRNRAFPCPRMPDRKGHQDKTQRRLPLVSSPPFRPAACLSRSTRFFILRSLVGESLESSASFPFLLPKAQLGRAGHGVFGQRHGPAGCRSSPFFSPKQLRSLISLLSLCG